MKSFSKLYSDFWINYDNSKTLSAGIDGRLMALYLQSNTHQNMLGVYYLPLLYISSDLKLPVEQVKKALKKLYKVNYCKYDARTQYVWVCNLVFDQIGVGGGAKDNRIMGLQAIWDSLPLQLEFLEDVYNKYGAKFKFESRAFIKRSEVQIKRYKINKRRKAVISTSIDDISINNKSNLNIDVLDAGENKNVNLVADINIKSVQEWLPQVVPFKGVSESLKSPTQDKSADTYEEKSYETPLKEASSFEESCSEVFEASDVSNTSNTTIVTSDLSGGARNEENLAAVTYSKGLRTPSEGALKSLPSPSEGPSNHLLSPFEGASDPLRSNIEYRSKNIEDRNKNTEDRSKKKELEKEKRKDLNKITVPNTNIVAQARRNKNSPDKNPLFLEKPKELEQQVIQSGPVENNKRIEKVDRVDKGDKNEIVEKTDPPITLASLNLASESKLGLEPGPGPEPESGLGSGLEPGPGPEPEPESGLGSGLEPGPGSESELVSVSIPMSELTSKNFRKIKKINSQNSVADSIAAVFEHWKKVMKHPRAKLDFKRQTLIQKALGWGYSVEDLCYAITGCFRTPFYTGDNKQGEYYTGLDVILRDADHIDKFIHNCHNPPKPQTEAKRRLASNAQVAKEWIAKKHNESANTMRNTRYANE